MGRDMLTEKGFRLIAKGYKPLTATDRGLLVYHKHALYLYRQDAFEKLLAFPAGFKTRLKSCTRLLERMARTEPQSAVCCDGAVFVARRHEVLRISLEDGRVVGKHTFRKSYIHTNRLAVIRGVAGFSDCVAYGEYLPNAKRESVCVFRKRLTDGEDAWDCAYTFPDGAIRHIHALIPDAAHACVYILTGDEDAESGIWRATDDFRTVEPLLVGDQAYRSCVAYIEGDALYYSTDIPSRQNTVTRVDLNTKITERLLELPGSSTVGGRVGDKLIFCTSVETEEPKSRKRLDMWRYLLGSRLPAGIKDAYPRVYLYDLKTEKTEEWLKFEKDIWPAGLFRFGRALPVYDELTDTLYLYPGSVKKYDGRLYSIRMNDRV